MGRIIYDTAATLNGWIADENHSLVWLFAVEGGDQPATGLFPAEASVLVEGSTTYEWVLAHEDLLARPQRWHEF
ncbi:MAG: dihydrofolate reductase, partial [Propionicimonas sp.]